MLIGVNTILFPLCPKPECCLLIAFLVSYSIQHHAFPLCGSDLTFKGSLGLKFLVPCRIFLGIHRKIPLKIHARDKRIAGMPAVYAEKSVGLSVRCGGKGRVCNFPSASVGSGARRAVTGEYPPLIGSTFRTGSGVRVNGYQANSEIITSGPLCSPCKCPYPR